MINNSTDILPDVRLEMYPEKEEEEEEKKREEKL